jgi:hypothetical protein
MRQSVVASATPASMQLERVQLQTSDGRHSQVDWKHPLAWEYAHCWPGYVHWRLPKGGLCGQGGIGGTQGGTLQLHAPPWQ